MIAYRTCLVALALFTHFVPGNTTNAFAYTTLSPAEVRTMVENGTAGTIIDVREDYEYCPSGHIPCALNYPLNSGVLPPVGVHAKVVQAAEDIFLPQDISDATYIVYTSDKNVVGLQLNGSMDWTMLDGLPALAVP